jgi:hypothetical protein
MMMKKTVPQKQEFNYFVGKHATEETKNGME